MVSKAWGAPEIYSLLQTLQSAGEQLLIACVPTEAESQRVCASCIHPMHLAHALHLSCSCACSMTGPSGEWALGMRPAKALGWGTACVRQGTKGMPISLSACCMKHSNVRLQAGNLSHPAHQRLSLNNPRTKLGMAGRPCAGLCRSLHCCFCAGLYRAISSSLGRLSTCHEAA